MNAGTLTVRVCTGLCCELAGATDMARMLPSLLGSMVAVASVPCLGRCEQGPAAAVGEFAIANATGEAVMNAVMLEQALPADSRGLAEPIVDFLDYESYRAEGGYAVPASIAAEEAQAGDVLAAIEASRVGDWSGVTLAQRWLALREQPHPREMSIVVQGGGTGAFRDRWLLERDPHRFLESMLVSAQVAGVASVKVLLPTHFAALHAMLLRQWMDVRENPPCELPLVEFVSSDAAPAADGALDCEMLHWLCEILAKGADWYAGFGRGGASGLRAYAVAGRVAAPGVKFAPAGIALQDLVEEFCDGMADERELHAGVCCGGPGAVIVLAVEDRERAVGLQPLLMRADAVK